MQKRKNKFTGYYLPEELLQEFQSKYPRLGTVFIRRCMINACKDKQFFDNIFFGVYDKYSSLGMNRPEYQGD